MTDTKDVPAWFKYLTGTVILCALLYADVLLEKEVPLVAYGTASIMMLGPKLALVMTDLLKALLVAK